MNVSVVWSMSNAWRIQVKGKDLVRTSATLADFQARPGLQRDAAPRAVRQPAR